MCKHYPALAKAYENFKTIYKMVEQDYKGNHEDNNDIPSNTFIIGKILKKCVQAL